MGAGAAASRQANKPSSWLYSGDGGPCPPAAPAAAAPCSKSCSALMCDLSRASLETAARSVHTQPSTWAVSGCGCRACRNSCCWHLSHV